MTRITIAGFLTAVSAACVLGMTCLGHCILRVPSESALGVAAPDARAASPSLDPELGEGTFRDACAREIGVAAGHGDDAQERTDSTGSLRTSDQRAIFLAGFEQEEGGLVAAVRRVLAGSRPDHDKVDALHALITTGSDEACDILADAVEEVPDASDPHGVSVPRCALRFLTELAGSDPRARAALERIAWNCPEVACGLRASAAASLAAVASGTQAWRVAGRLQTECDPLVRAAAAEAMSRNTDSSAAAAFQTLGIRVAETVREGEEVP